MRRHKKFIAIALLATVLVVGSIGGVALAQENGDDSQPETILARVAEKLGINQQELEDAFTEAQSEMRDEALDGYLQNLVEEGKITEGEADQYRAWWQARPDTEPYRQQLREWEQTRPGIPSELEEWQEARPDIPLPGPFGRFGGQGFPGPMKGGGGGCFWGR